MGDQSLSNTIIKQPIENFIGPLNSNQKRAFFKLLVLIANQNAS